MNEEEIVLNKNKYSGEESGFYLSGYEITAFGTDCGGNCIGSQSVNQILRWVGEHKPELIPMILVEIGSGYSKRLSKNAEGV